MKYKILMPFVIIALMFTLVLPGCNEELPPVQADELVIPSSLTPDKVFIEIANAGPFIYTYPFFQGVWSAKHMDPYAMPQGATEEQFTEGYNAVIPEFLYIKSDGEQAGYAEYKLVLYIFVLKYEDMESAERSFTNISETQEFQNLTYEGITLKNGTYTLADWEEYEEYYWDEPKQPCYLIYSGCFVIYFYGREDVLNDMLDRIIVAFGVKE